jgi:hypothetical protein
MAVARRAWKPLTPHEILDAVLACQRVGTRLAPERKPRGLQRSPDIEVVETKAYSEVFHA